jgi:hypothetical protein
VVRVETAEGGLSLSSGFRARLVPLGDGRFEVADYPGMTVTIRRPVPGAPLRLMAPVAPPPEERTMTFGRAELLAPRRGEELGIYAGTYVSDEIGVEWTIVTRREDLVLRRRRFEDQVLEPASRGVYIGDAGTFRFLRDDRQHVVGFTFTVPSGRLRNVRFEKAAACPCGGTVP